ncbi:MAG: phosphoenolpyruvate mutase [Planctomycetota bacterium]
MQPQPSPNSSVPACVRLPHAGGRTVDARDRFPNKTRRLRHLLERPGLDFLMEAHSGLSARIAEEAGFEAVWASGLSISAALGVRDCNEASWTQVLELLEFMADASSVPILVDGDTGHGNFNNVRRFVRKLEQCGLAGVCLEDKLFPKTNSFLDGHKQQLAHIDEFCGRLRAAKDSQWDDQFVVVARVEAFIAGWGLDEALRRAEAYRAAGADAILIHSALRSPEEVLAFQREWADRAPVVIVPTKYCSTPTAVFREAGFRAAIWANHLLRASLKAMQETAQRIFRDQSLAEVESTVAPLHEVFRLQGADELKAAEARYLPQQAGGRAIVLAATRGPDLPELTAERPKCMIEVGGRPVLAHVVSGLRAAGIRDIHVVRGYHKEAVTVEGVSYHDNDDIATTHELHTLQQALPALEGTTVIAFGDVLFRKFIVQELLETEDDFAVFVDGDWKNSRNRDRQAELACCSEPMSLTAATSGACLLDVVDTAVEPLGDRRVDGEWMGFLKVSARGAEIVREALQRLLQDPQVRRTGNMATLLRELVRAGNPIRVLYTAGNWLDIDSVQDAIDAGTFR